jgi:hypothetical protein
MIEWPMSGVVPGARFPLPPDASIDPEGELYHARKCLTLKDQQQPSRVTLGAISLSSDLKNKVSHGFCVGLRSGASKARFQGNAGSLLYRRQRGICVGPIALGIGTGGFVQSAAAKIARSGLPVATSTDSARASEALGLFVGDTVACLDVQR